MGKKYRTVAIVAGVAAFLGIMVFGMIRTNPRRDDARQIAMATENAARAIQVFNEANREAGLPWRQRFLECAPDSNRDKYGSCSVLQYPDCEAMVETISAIDPAGPRWQILMSCMLADAHRVPLQCPVNQIRDRACKDLPTPTRR